MASIREQSRGAWYAGPVGMKEVFVESPSWIVTHQQELEMRQRSCQCSPRTSLSAGWLVLGAILFLIAPTAPLAGMRVLAQQSKSTIAGQAVDSATKEGISGVAITTEGSRLAAITGQDGRYRIANVPAGTYTLVARRLGYSPQRHRVTTDGENEVVVDFALQAAATSLSEIIV